MKNEVWPNALMLGGFLAAAFFWGLLFFANLSPTLEVLVTIGENLSIGIGSIGFGGKLTQMRRSVCR